MMKSGKARKHLCKYRYQRGMSGTKNAASFVSSGTSRYKTVFLYGKTGNMAI